MYVWCIGCVMYRIQINKKMIYDLSFLPILPLCLGMLISFLPIILELQLKQNVTYSKLQNYPICANLSTVVPQNNFFMMQLSCQFTYFGSSWTKKNQSPVDIKVVLWKIHNVLWLNSVKFSFTYFSSVQLLGHVWFFVIP